MLSALFHCSERYFVLSLPQWTLHTIIVVTNPWPWQWSTDDSLSIFLSRILTDLVGKLTIWVKPQSGITFREQTMRGKLEFTSYYLTRKSSSVDNVELWQAMHSPVCCWLYYIVHNNIQAFLGFFFTYVGRKIFRYLFLRLRSGKH